MEDGNTNYLNLANGRKPVKKKICQGCNGEKCLNAFPHSGDICQGCMNKFARVNRVFLRAIVPSMRNTQMQQARKVRAAQKQISPVEADEIINAFVAAWERKERSKAEFECLYIDCCKWLGRERRA